MSDEPPHPDADRRRFFGLFAGDVATSLGSILGAARALQQESADAAKALLTGIDPAAPGEPGVATPPSAAGMTPHAGVAPAPAVWDATAAGYRAAFTWDGDRAHLVDQRQLPDILGDVVVESAGDAVASINDGVIHGGAVHGQLAAISLAIAASRSRLSRPFARRAMMRGSSNALRQTRPASAAVSLATDRMLAAFDELGVEALGDEVAEAMRLEAEAIVAEATADHGRIAELAPGALPGEPGSPLHLLTLGSTGALSGGTFGTALGAIMTLHHAGRPVHVLVAETRPHHTGSRLAAWELRQAGVEHAVVSDAAAPGCIASGDIDAVLVSAERIACNGDVIGVAGTYPLALAAAAEGVPFIVCAATSTIDPAVAEGVDAAIEEARPAAVLTVNGRRIALEGTPIRNPLQDLTPAALVSSIVTEEGVLRAPYAESIAVAMAAADQRRSASRGYRALLARRSAAAASPEGPDASADATANLPAEP